MTNLHPLSSTIFESNLPPIQDLPQVSVWDFLRSGHSHPSNSSDEDVAFLDEDSREYLSFRDLYDSSQAMAFALRHRLGLKSGDTVVVFSENTLNYPIVLLAIQTAGCICSPANSAFQPTELAYQITDSQAKIVLASKAKYSVALAACGEAEITNPVVMDGENPFEVDSASNENIWRLMDNNKLEPAVVMPREAVEATTLLCYSSGTSGRPKGVKTSHYNITSAVLQSLALSPSSYGLQESWIACLPLSHMYGLFMHIYVALYIRAKIVVMGKFDLVKYANAVQTHKVTACHIVPPIAIRLTKDLGEGYDFSSVREWRSAAAPLGQEAIELLNQRFGIPLHSIYAMTETTAVISHTSCNLADKPSSVGFLGPNMKAKIVDGELLVKGPNIMLGYHNRSDANAEAFDEDGYMRTGDVVRVDKDGHFFIVDRVKEIIKYNGYQVPPAELEDILISHDEVTDAAVIGVADPSTGTEYPTAFVVLKLTNESSDQQGLQILRETLLQYVSGQVAHYKYLRGGITFVDSIPKSPSGKILRKRLRELMLHHQAQASQGLPCRKIFPSPS